MSRRWTTLSDGYNPCMRSAEAAELAGVTTRTLRHYHRIGILDEPPRSANGYREYSLAQVARVIRIRRLAALGVPLERTAPLLESGSDAAADLERIDTELAEQIEALKRRRLELDEIRQSRHAPDLASGIAPFAEALTDGLSGALADLVVHEMVVGYEMTPERDRAEFARVMGAILEPSARARLRDINIRLSSISDEASDSEVGALAESVAEFNLNEFPRTPVREKTAADALALEVADRHWAAHVRAVQLRVLDQARRAYQSAASGDS